MPIDGPPRLLLDTNVWRYIVDADQVRSLRAVVKEGRARLIVAPAVVYEMLRTRDPALRRKLVRAATLGTWDRLMTEAFEESQAILAVVRRHRPEWLNSDPDLASFFRLRADWTGNFGFWRRARKDPASEARMIAMLEGDVFDRASVEARQNRSDFKALQFHDMKLTGWTARLPHPVPGWDGSDIDSWRIQARDVWWHGLVGQRQRAYVEWTEPFLDLAAIRRSAASWTHLWFHEVETTEVPREWLRWAVRLLQSTRTVTAGTPGDNQISSYLLDADGFLTADRAFADIVARVHDAGVFATARPHLVTTPDDPITALNSVLARDGSGSS
jgi:hypothetical protein